MAYDAKILEVMIASPSDVTVEREIVRDIVAEWNALNARERSVVLLPLGWDTHSSPELGGRPQQMINDRILVHADILIGIFWTKLGTPTGTAQSGTAEEIQTHYEAGKPVLLYFSEVPIVAGHVNHEQFSALQEFKAWALPKGLVHSFATKDQFKDDLRRHLQLCIQNNEYVAALTDIDLVAAFNDAVGTQQEIIHALSSEAKQLLTMAGKGSNNHIMLLRHLGGTSISAGGQSISNKADVREASKWRAAIDELAGQALVVDLNGKGEIHELTHKGFLEAERIGASEIG
jgi:hypothetical protein